MLGDLSFGTLIIVLLALIISISLHESMHAYAAHWLGDDTAHEQGRISLNPLRHIDLYSTILLPIVTLVIFKVPLLAAKPVPFNPSRVRWGEYGAALVGLAGPATNLVLAVVAGLLAHLIVGSASGGVITAIKIFVEINVALFVFNMIPIPPLDGSRALYSVAPEAVQAVMAQMERWGIVIIFALVLAVPAFSNMLINLNNSVLRLIL
ncbi:MAG: site-2 protease family protein [Candidatus Saccharimonadales bacterium]